MIDSFLYSGKRNSQILQREDGLIEQVTVFPFFVFRHRVFALLMILFRKPSGGEKTARFSYFIKVKCGSKPLFLLFQQYMTAWKGLGENL